MEEHTGKVTISLVMAGLCGLGGLGTSCNDTTSLGTAEALEANNPTSTTPAGQPASKLPPGWSAYASCPANISANGGYVAPGGSATGPALTVNAQASGLYPISRDIYGMNSGGTVALISGLRIPVQRLGGDAMSRYNWKVDSSNAGFDWYFMGGSGASPVIPNATVDTVVQSERSVSGKSVITVPMLGYLTSSALVSSSNPNGLIKDGVVSGRTISGTMGYVNSTATINCSFPTSVYGAQQSTNPYVHPNGNEDCGNSLTTSGAQLTLTETQKLANHIYTNPGWNQSWVQYLVQTYGSASKGGIQIYQLDNEPSGWANTHRDVRPEVPTGAEITQMGLLHGQAVKAADPTALVMGPSDYGYQVYGTGMGGNYAPAYLMAMAAYETQTGQRILDYFDEHYYPFEAGIANQPAGDAANQALRLESTRGLWDPTYASPVTWIPQPIQLIPMLRNYISTFYPGTKLAITEYNFGAPESINGALAEADVLGIFAREKVDLATMWTPPASTQPAAFAFAMYLNYDGGGSSFGDMYVPSQSADQSRLSIYSATRSCDGALTTVVINKTGGTLVSKLSLGSFQPASTALVYNYSSSNLNQIVRQPDMPVAASGFTAAYPANSITLVIVPAAK